MTSDLLADADAIANRTDLRHHNVMRDIKFECNDWQNACILLCPRCGGNYLHHKAIETFERGEDDKKGMHTVVTADHVDVKYDSLVGNPSLYRHGFKVKFYCENCHESLTMELYQHKGQTWMSWDI